MLALLLLLRGRRSGPVPCACADVATLSAANLLQWPQLAGGPVTQAGHRLSDGRQRFQSHSGLATGAAHCQRMGSKANAWAARRAGPAVLPDLSGLRRRVSLERGPVRIRH